MMVEIEIVLSIFQIVLLINMKGENSNGIFKMKLSNEMIRLCREKKKVICKQLVVVVGIGMFDFCFQWVVSGLF